MQSFAYQQASQSRAHLWASSMRLSASSRYRPQLCPEIVSQVCARPVADPHSQQKDCAGHQAAECLQPHSSPTASAEGPAKATPLRAHGVIAGLGVGAEPVLRLTVIIALCLPLPPPASQPVHMSPGAERSAVLITMPWAEACLWGQFRWRATALMWAVLLCSIIC